MAIIYNYPLNSILLAEDMLIGTSTNIVNGQPKNATKNFSIADLTGFIKQNVSLNDVLLVGNTSLLDAKVGGLYLYDTPVTDYGNIVLNQNRFSFNTVTHSEVFRAQRDMFSSFSSSGYRGSFEVSSITANRVWDFPDKPGTVALLSDIPPGVTQNLQDVTDIGSITTNTITVGSFLGDFSQVLSTAIGTQNHTTGTYAYLDSSGYLGLNNGTAESYLKNTDVTNINVILEFPNKSTGSYTIATLDDIPVITTPTLQEVTDAGAITTDSITVGEITSNYFIANDVDYNSEMAPGYFITTNAATTTFGILEFSQLVLETPASSIKMTATGITFPNASIQVTAFPPTGGTASQYIKGNGTLGTFPAITIPTLQQVTTEGNTTSNEIIIIDEEVSVGATQISLGYGSFYNLNTNKITTISADNDFTFQNGANILYLKSPVTISGTNIQTLQNASGTVALLSDIPPSSVSPLTTKGDLYTYSTVDARLPVGLNTQVLLADSSTTTGLKWGTNTAPTPLGYYGAFSDVTDQFATVINTGYPMLLGVTDLSNGVTVVSGSRITIANTGIYNIQWSGQFRNPTANEHDVTIWLRKNGVDVPGSAGVVAVPKKHGSFDGHTLPSWNFLVDPIAGDYYEFVWSTQALAVFLSFEPAGSPPPSTASVVLTVTQQSGIMAGTGITAINSLTGSTQTMVVGTGAANLNIVSSGSTHTFNLLSNIRRNANNSSNNNINYNGYAVTGSAESSAVWTITRLTISASGSITVGTATNVAWTNRESAIYI